MCSLPCSAMAEARPLAPPRVMVIGSCHVHQAAEVLAGDGLIETLVPTNATVNNTAEHRQVLERCLEDREGPGDFAPICALPRDASLADRRALIAAADAAIIDIGAPLAFELDWWQCNAGALVERIVEPA